MAAIKKGTIGIALGFAPWVAWAAASARGQGVLGLSLGLLSGGSLLLWQWRTGRVKAMEVASAGFFALSLLLRVGLGWRGLETCAVPVLYGALAAMAWTTLALGSPFTLQYAREDWPEALWDQPLFRTTNRLLTWMWALVFTANAALAASVLLLPGLPRWLSAGAIPHLGTAVGVAASVLVPRFFPRWAIARKLAAAARPGWTATFEARRPPGPDRHDVVIVGAGIGGLASAALLARRGLKVLVLDHHYLPGGFCTSWSRQVRRGADRLTYTFDAGVHDVSGLGPNGPVRWLLRRLGLEDRIEWLHLPHEYFTPSLHLKVPRSARQYEEQLAQAYPEQRAGLRRFFGEMEAVYRELFQDVPRTGGLPLQPATVEEVLAYPAAHPHAIRWMDQPFTAMLEQLIGDPALRDVLCALAGYLTDRPEALTVGTMAPLFGYYFDGGYYPRGGSQRLADALVSAIEERGGEVRLRTSVRRILVEGGKAVGVELASGRIERAGAVVSNADAKRTFQELIAAEHVPEALRAQVAALRPSASALHVTLGLDYQPGVEAMTLVKSERGDLGIINPSKVDPTLAPPGHSALVLVSLVPPDQDGGWDRRSPDYRRRKKEACDALIARAGQVLPGLESHIVYRQDGTPATVARYAWTTGGAIYGPALGGRLEAKTPIEGLVLAGSGVFPGAGIEGVAISGMIAADLVCPAVARAG